MIIVDIGEELTVTEEMFEHGRWREDLSGDGIETGSSTAGYESDAQHFELRDDGQESLSRFVGVW